MTLSLAFLIGFSAGYLTAVLVLLIIQRKKRLRVTDEPTEAEIKAALDAFVGGDFYADYPGSVQHWEPMMRAALVAAVRSRWLRGIG